MRVRHSANLLFALVLSFFYAQPSESQSAPDNLPNALSPVGIPPLATTSGTNEQIVLSTGALNISLPILTLHQQGGWDLVLGYNYNSNRYHPIQDVEVGTSVTTSSGQPANSPQSHTTTLSYLEAYRSFDQLLEPNLPRLQASSEYYGNYREGSDSQDDQPYNVDFCMTTFVFTDWSGTTHTFNPLASCSDKDTSYGAPLPYTQADSADGAFYHLETPNSNQAIVTAPDGTTYVFTGTWDPNTSVAAHSPGSQNNNLENYYDNRVMTMTDPNGISVSVVPRSDQTTAPITAWVLTDSLNRSVSIGQDGISYLDANAQSATAPSVASLSSSAGPPLSSPLSYGGMDCKNNNSNMGLTNVQLEGSSTLTSSTATTLLTLALPASDSYGNKRTYKLLFDPDAHLIRIDYPSGGYTRYDFVNYETLNINQNIACGVDMFQVSAKHVCSIPGGCGTEDTTTYTSGGVNDVVMQADQAYNTTVTEVDPLGTKITHSFSTTPSDSAQNSGINKLPLERNTVTSDSTGHLLKTVHTSYACYYYMICYPTTVTTTLNDSPNGATSTETKQHNDTYTLTGWQMNYPVALNHVNEVDEFDFSGSQRTSVVNRYEPASAFSVPQILNKIASTSSTDKVTGQVATTTYGYDPVGNVSSVTTSANDIVTMTKTYGPYTNGYPAWMQDGKGYKTTFGYANNFVPGPCVPAQSSAYPTSVLAPDGSTTTYQYNACTGSIAAVTDTNGNTASYSYDALGRQTSAAKPGAFASTTQYSDAIPNTTTVTAKATPNPDFVSVTTLDGLGRTASLVKGDLEIDTTYDSVGRTWYVYEPKIVGSSSTGATVTTYDGLDRVIQVTNPDGTSATNDVQGEMSVVRDEVGSTKVITKNSQGLPVAICEVAPAFAPSGESPSACPSLANESSLQGYTTQYVYDGRGNLTNVNARQQSRSFSYDSLSRLVQANNPETGTICYGQSGQSGCTGSYDANGNLGSKTDARSIVTTFGYDMLNRVTSKNFSDGTPSACFGYASGSSATAANGNGRLAQEWTQAGGCSAQGNAITARTILAYDPAGRITKEQQCTFGSCANGNGTMQYGYDLVGSMAASTNGSNAQGIALTYTSDLSQRPLGVTSSWDDPNHPATLFSADPTIIGTQAYGPFGLIAAQMGISSNQPAVLNETDQYDSRGRVTSHAVLSSGALATNPVSISMDANPDPAGVMAQTFTSCDSTCGTGYGYWTLDGSNIGGFSYSPGQVNWNYVNPNLPVGSTHQLQSVFNSSSGTTYTSPVLSFTIAAASSVPTITMSAPIVNNPVPVGESGEIDISLSCKTNCGPARGEFRINGNFAGGFDLDENGTAVVYTPNNLAVGSYPVEVLWYGDGTHSSAQQNMTLTIANPPIPPGTTTATVAPFIGNPQGDVTDLLAGEWAMMTIKNQCNSACGGGQFFVDGNFEGGYVLDNTGSGVVYMYVPQGAEGTHQVTVNYAGNNSYAPYDMPAVSANVIDSSNLPVLQIQAAPVSTPVSAGSWSPLQITLTPNAASCAQSGQVLAQGNYVGGGTGDIFVDGNWSDWFYIHSDGTVVGNGRQYPLLRPTSSTGTHTLTVNFWGNNACGPTSQSFSYTNQ